MGHTPIAKTFNFEAEAQRIERRNPWRWTPEKLASYLAEKRTAWETMSEAERKLRLLLGKLYHDESLTFDDTDRPLHVTPFGGAYGLAGCVWTTNLSRAHRVSRQFQTGLVWVNTWFLRDLRTPFGGVKLSGLGREGGRHSLDFYSEITNICLKL